jgi:hypothetical protein
LNKISSDEDDYFVSFSCKLLNIDSLIIEGLFIPCQRILNL